MFLKQTAFKPRSNSQSSSNESPADNPSNSAASVSTYQGRRRSSATEKFAGLQAHKRTSQDESTASKKASFAEQKPGSQGVLGSMWSNFTKGT